MRSYWLVMTYGCKGCGFEMDFYLEDGCEGPRVRTVPGKYPKDHPTDPGKPVDVPVTGSGRIMVPVPFAAGRCADCGEDDMLHIRWADDRRLEPMATTVPEDCGAFLYPEDAGGPELRSIFDSSCGRPVYPKARPADNEGESA